jgi:two-component system nitrogen regulation response regulator NtrX
VERLVIMAPDDCDKIRLDMLPPEITSPMPAPMQIRQEEEIMGLPLRDARELFERQYLLAQIGRFGGNISRTAEFVGMERSALHRKMKSLGINARTSSAAAE